MQDINIFKIIIEWLMPVVLTGIFTFLAKNQINNSAMKKSMLSLIRSQIVGKCETYMKQECLPEYARYCLQDLFEQYKQLGGNHGIEILVDKCFQLPLKKEEIYNEKK